MDDVHANDTQGHEDGNKLTFRYYRHLDQKPTIKEWIIMKIAYSCADICETSKTGNRHMEYPQN